MRPAPVGFHCPDDVAQAAREARPLHNQLGGPAGSSQPIVTWTLVALNAVAFVLEGFPLGGVTQPGNAFFQHFEQDNPLVHDQPYRLLTAAFLHDGILHIGLNMLVLVLIGQQLEQVIGRARFLALYLVSALGGGTSVYLLDPRGAVGASGAIFGLFAAFYLVARKLRIDARSMLATIGINLVLSVVIPGISLYGHLGGLITGAVVGLIYTSLPSRTPAIRAAQVGAALAVAGVLVIVVAVAPMAAST